MQLSEIIRQAEKELQTATRNLDMAKRRGAPEQDVRNLEAKVEYRKAVLDILNVGNLELFGKVERLEKENADLLARAERAEREINKQKQAKECILNVYLENAKSLQDIALENEITHSKLEKVEREKDAAIFDLTRAKEAAEETYRLLDNEVHQACDYSLYMALHDSVSDIINWEKDNVWRKKEE